MLGRPGAYFFSINYEWACTCRAAPSPDNSSARLVRVLDWKTPGLGANLVCAKVEGAKAGPFAVVTWPGYNGGSAGDGTGAFFGCSQPSADARSDRAFLSGLGGPTADAFGKCRIRRPAHLLRKVAEEAQDFNEARRVLAEQPISTPGIFTLAGIAPDETAVIERREHESRVRGGDVVAANHWDSPGWLGQSRGESSVERSRTMSEIDAGFDEAFAWLVPPVLNQKTRLAMVADAKAGPSHRARI